MLVFLLFDMLRQEIVLKDSSAMTGLLFPLSNRWHGGLKTLDLVLYHMYFANNNWPICFRVQHTITILGMVAFSHNVLRGSGILYYGSLFFSIILYLSSNELSEYC
jgi:hypothetical protein